jgi:hypothetical protein
MLPNNASVPSYFLILIVTNLSFPQIEMCRVLSGEAHWQLTAPIWLECELMPLFAGLAVRKSKQRERS